MKNKLRLLSILLLSNVFLGLAQSGPGAPGPGGHPNRTPIDTNEIILIIAAVLLTVGVIAYKKLSLKKA
ncbi:hypothetical protein KRX57_03455 [Weeksellaceae bacterium TAE3-ERU29]|nr:hypothetical protein [Weeksellaceae bacterium TAE3-ERU29]